MNLNYSELTITSLETFTLFDTAGNYICTLDELQDFTIQNSQETTDVTGKGGRKLNTLKRNKGVTISGNNGFVSGGLLEFQTGGEFATKTTDVLWTDYLTIEDDTAATTYVATGTSGAEIEALYIRNDDGSLGTKLEQADTAAAGKFAYAPSTKALTFVADAYADGTEIVVFYKRTMVADVLENYSDVFSKKGIGYLDAFAEDSCNNQYRIQFYLPRIDFSGEFSIEFGDNQTVHAFEASSLANHCLGNNGLLWTYTVFGANELDAPALSSIAVTTAPTDTSYSAGEAFNSTGMVITATYSDGSSKAVTGYTFSPVTALTTSDTTITITYTEGGVTKTTTQAITVS